MQKIRILIVDDSSVVREGLCSIIKTQSDLDIVGQAIDGLDAIDQASELHPNIILMDAQMPGTGGVEATRRIKELFPEIKVLFLTVHTGYIEDALAAGVDSYLMKDCGRKELLKAIRELAAR
jgi:DNA-binding NarL/FixJ family response regulator